MRKPSTGEPCAGEPHARFGGRGGRKPFPTPIKAIYRRYEKGDCRVAPAGFPAEATLQLGSGITSEYGHYVKSPGEP